MTSKQLLFDKSARESLSRGVDIVADAVKVTLGPRGRNVIIEIDEYNQPITTKDGVTVAQHINLKDPFENMGAQLCKQVSGKTNEVAGDGTTTATVLAQAILREALQYIAAKGNPTGFKKGLDLGAELTLEILDKFISEVKDEKQVEFVATISGNSSEVGKFISEAIVAVGSDGIITIEESKDFETSIDLVEGIELDRGYTSQYFANNKKKLIFEANDCAIFLHEGRITSATDMAKALEKISKANISTPVLFIADDYDESTSQMLVLNTIRAGFKWCAIKTPGFGDQKKDYIKDLSIATGGTVITESEGRTLTNFEMSWLGKAKKVTVEKDKTTIIEGNSDSELLMERIEQLKELMSKTEADYDRKLLENRLSKLSEGAAVIRIGAATDAELKEKKYRFEDALNATKAAISEGVVPGGGVALLRASQELNKKINKLDNNLDIKTGIKILSAALEAPIRQILENAGCKGDVIVEKILKNQNKNFGLNVETMQYCDLIKTGVIDPVKVTKSALLNAVSIAGLLITTEAIITNVPVEGEKVLVSADGMY